MSTKIILRPELIGCVGNSPGAEKFLNKLSDIWESYVETFLNSSFAQFSSTSVAAFGTFPELDSLVKDLPYRCEDPASLALSLLRSEKDASKGVKKIIAHLNYSEYLLAIKEPARLWLICDSLDAHILMSDRRKYGGNVFFFPGYEGEESVYEPLFAESFPDGHRVFEMPNQSVWMFPHVGNIRQFKFTKTKYLDKNGNEVEL